MFLLPKTSVSVQKQPTKCLSFSETNISFELICIVYNTVKMDMITVLRREGRMNLRLQMDSYDDFEIVCPAKNFIESLYIQPFFNTQRRSVNTHI